MPFMTLTREMSRETPHLLARIYRQSRHHWVRQRVHGLLLHSQGMKPNNHIGAIWMFVHPYNASLQV